jgi:glycine/D-amino acid oxidase-like deaminating enzyme
MGQTDVSKAEVVVIGAGVIGCSVALHLAEAGVSDVVVVDRDGLAQGTSSAGAGFVGEWAAGWDPRLREEELAIERYGLAFYARLEEEGASFGRRGNGNLYLARTEEVLERDFVPYLAPVPNGVRLSADEVGTLTEGVVAAEAIAGGILHPSGGQVSAGDAGRAMALRFLDLGGRIETRLPVQRILVERGRVRGVRTSRGTIACDRVVLAAGAWANILLRPLGAYLPYVPLVAMRVVTEPLGIPSVLPTLMLHGPSSYVREENGGLLWSAASSAPPRRAFVDIDPPERFDQLPLDAFFEMRERDLASIAEVVPALGRARSSTVAFGAPTYTPDGRALIGPVADIDGLTVVSGCNEGGVTHGPGFGRLTAELLTGADPSICSLAPFAIDRFGDPRAATADLAGVASY